MDKHQAKKVYLRFSDISMSWNNFCASYLLLFSYFYEKLIPIHYSISSSRKIHYLAMFLSVKTVRKYILISPNNILLDICVGIKCLSPISTRSRFRHKNVARVHKRNA
jgi:hypothetical protein